MTFRNLDFSRKSVEISKSVPDNLQNSPCYHWKMSEPTDLLTYRIKYLILTDRKYQRLLRTCFFLYMNLNLYES